MPFPRATPIHCEATSRCTIGRHFSLPPLCKTPLFFESTAFGNRTKSYLAFPRSLLLCDSCNEPWRFQTHVAHCLREVDLAAWRAPISCDAEINLDAISIRVVWANSMYRLVLHQHRLTRLQQDRCQRRSAFDAIFVQDVWRPPDVAFSARKGALQFLV